MPSQFFGLNIAYTGLLASNAALNTTSNNIANVSTEGYSRQEVKQQASNALRVFQKYGCAGAGVDTLAIERIHDDFYDNKYWNNRALTGEYSDKAYYMKQIENYFSDGGKENPGFTTIFNSMQVSLQEVMKNAESVTTKAQYVSSMSSLTEYFNNMYGNMQKLQKDVNAEIKLKIDEIDSIAAEVASINKQINVIEMGGGHANELRDRRTLLIDQLSEIVDVETQEIPIRDTNYPDRVTGANRYIVTIAGGQTLVDDSEYNTLTCIAKKGYEKVNQSDIDGLYDVYWENNQKFDLHNAAMGGALKGLVAVRDGNNSENFAGRVIGTGETTLQVKNLETGVMEDKQFDTVTVSVTNEYLKDLNKCNLSDMGGIIRLGNNLYYYDSWSVTKNTSGDYEYTFVISDEKKNTQKLTNDRVGMEASIGTAIDYQGIPYYMEQMNEWVRTFSQHVNDILNNGYDKYGNEGYNFLTADHNTDSDQYNFKVGIRLDGDHTGTFNQGVNATDDDTLSSYYWMTAGNFNVNASFINDADLLATRNVNSNGKDDYSTVEDLYKMFSDKDQMSFRGCSASEFLECILSDVALNASKANTFTKSYTDISTAINNQRISISGVDEDDEAVNLVKYQNAYNLASKMIQTLTEVYDRLILYTGV
ncbi:flagellar hook-associated protein 1 FlgK [Lachnospiraceae bacterium G11]|nr:flagellar hook-associated protein 1 FlgK [Lachnospiraceae bacterium G11]